MQERVITDNAGEELRVKWDGTRFALIETPIAGERTVIVLNPREMLDLIDFARTLGGE